ncbi:hypothetical protein RHGRI_032521 [Rhododendron griersonianum]|uniref:Uncharacterized protein n=1 Tax=Rhododendron griersonianum TaxID=479676 RepID=A0AAV6IEK6_9ERIC|nr:hypothetical protein RHGRI_032521 [Rhododendron griersonianum]
MGTSSITLSPPHSLSSFPKTIFHSSNPPQNFTILQFQLRRLYPRVQASRRISNFPQVGLGIEDYADGDDDDDEEEQEEDRSLDLLVKFVENVFKKVGFSVNGVILLAFLWILKAFLELLQYRYVSVPTHFFFYVYIKCRWSAQLEVPCLLVSCLSVVFGLVYPIYNKAATIGQMNTMTTIMHGLVHGLYLEFPTPKQKTSSG